MIVDPVMQQIAMTLSIKNVKFIGVFIRVCTNLRTGM